MKHEARPEDARTPRRRSAVGGLLMVLGICVMLGLVAKIALLPPADPDAAERARLAREGWIICYLGEDGVEWAHRVSREIDEATDWVDEVFVPEITRGTPPEPDDEPPAPAP